MGLTLPTGVSTQPQPSEAQRAHSRSTSITTLRQTRYSTAKMRILADDNRTPILVDAAMFAANSQPIPRSWVATIREGGVVELGPRAWLEHGFWERYFDGDPDAIAAFRREVEAMTDMSHQS